LIVGPTGIFTDAEFDPNNGRDASEFRKTAAVMKLVMNGYAGAGTIEMGGYDYHGGARARSLHGCLPRIRCSPPSATDDVCLQ
jgi:hypothetical protein